MDKVLFLAFLIVIGLWPPATCVAADVESTLRAANISEQTLPTLTFPEVLAFAIAQSTEAKSASEALRQTELKKDQTDYLYYPQVGALGQESGSGNNHGAMTLDKTAEMNAKVHLYHFGADAAQRRKAKIDVESALLSKEATTQGIELTAALAAFNVIDLAQERDITQAMVAANKESLSLSKRLYSLGLHSEQEVEKVIIDFANIEAQLADAEEALIHAKAVLAVLLGRQVNIRPVWPWREHFSTQSRTLPDKPGLADLPERQALLGKISALELQMEVINSARMPSLDLSSSYAWTTITERDPNLGYNVGDLHMRKWSVGLLFSVPLFDRFAARTDYEVYGSQKTQAELDLLQEDRQLDSGYREARAGFKIALSSALKREITEDQARKLYEHSLKNFRDGVLSANDLSLDQQRLLDTAQKVVRSWSSVHQYFARLCHLMGRPLAECASSLFPSHH